jgi:hypothetical protein
LFELFVVVKGYFIRFVVVKARCRKFLFLIESFYQD